MGKITESALELVGKTPLLRASRYAKNVGAGMVPKGPYRTGND